MLASASGELKTRALPKSPLQIGGDFEDAALAFHLFEILLARAIGDVFAKDHDALVARHLVVKARVDQIDHRLRSASVLLVRRRDALVCGVEVLRSRIDIGRVDVQSRGFFRGLWRGQGFIGRAVYFVVDFFGDAV